VSEPVFQTFRVQIQAGPARSSVMGARGWILSPAGHHRAKSPIDQTRHAWCGPDPLVLPLSNFKGANRLPVPQFQGVRAVSEGGQDQIQAQVDQVTSATEIVTSPATTTPLLTRVRGLANRNPVVLLQCA